MTQTQLDKLKTDWKNSLVGHPDSGWLDVAPSVPRFFVTEDAVTAIRSRVVVFEDKVPTASNLHFYAAAHKHPSVADQRRGDIQFAIWYSNGDLDDLINFAVDVSDHISSSERPYENNEVPRPRSGPAEDTALDGKLHRFSTLFWNEPRGIDQSSPRTDKFTPTNTGLSKTKLRDLGRVGDVRFIKDATTEPSDYWFGQESGIVAVINRFQLLKLLHTDAEIRAYRFSRNPAFLEFGNLSVDDTLRMGES